MLNRIQRLIAIAALVATGPLFADEAALKSALNAAENRLSAYLSGSNTCGGTVNNQTTNHSVTFSWSPGSKRKVTISQSSYTMQDGKRTDMFDATYEIEIIQGETGSLSGTDPTAAGWVKISAPSVQIKKTVRGVVTMVNEAAIKRPCKNSPGDFSDIIAELSRTAKAYWIWARDRG